MLSYIVLIIGVCMILAGIALAFLNRSAANVIPLILLGTICSLVGEPGLANLVLKIGGQEATITMKDLKTGANDIQEQLATNNQKLKSLSDAFDKQVKVNEDINAKFAAIDAKLGLATTSSLPADVVAVSPAVASKNGYVVLVFYKDQRTQDATALKEKLIEAGYQASAINSSLAETTIGPQPDNSAYIVFTARGGAIVASLESLIKQSSVTASTNPVGKNGPYPLRRGDDQIYLF